MKIIFKGLIPLTIFSLTIGIGAGILFNNHEASSANNEYSITFNSETNHFHDKSTPDTGTTDDIKTASGRPVSFSYINVIGQVNESWHVIDSNGSFQNTSRINGISNLTIAFKSLDLSFKIEWSKDANFADTHSQTYTSSSEPNYCSFDSYSPNYFRLVNTSGSLLDIESMTLNFSCVIKYPTIKITNSNDEHGDIYSSIVNGEYEALTNFRIAATGKNGHTFDGWYDPRTNEKYSSDLILDLTLMNEDIYLEARYKEVTDNKYQVFTLVGDNGSAEGSGKYSVNQEVNLISMADDGYYSLGWFYPDTSQSEEMENPTYTITNMPSNDLCFVTKFVELYDINYSVGSGEGTISGPTTAIEGQEVTLTATPDFNKEYAFDCWKDENGEEISQDNPYTFTMPNHNLNLVVEFKKGIKLNLISSNDNYGTVAGSGYYLEGRNVTINATCKNDNVFFGWYDSNQYLGSLSLKNTYQYTMGSTASTLYAKFLSASEYQAWASSHGGTPSNITETSLTYGLYPKSHVNDTVLITELERYAPKADEEYFFYDNEYYVKDTGNPYVSDYTFEDGTTVEKSKTYYFKCEPITWNIIPSNNGTYSLDCSNILNANSYDDSGSNNYKDSDIRAWLNNDFYNQAFFLNNSNIQTTKVDNSAATTDKEPNPYACDDTDDKIYLRSYQDWKNIEASSRIKKVSDFALCNYAYMLSSTSRNGCYWTRSPFSGGSIFAWRVHYDGDLDIGLVHYSYYGCSPALTITI